MSIDKYNEKHDIYCMLYTVSITSQGQITIPADIQRVLGLKKKTKATIFIDEGRLIIEPVKDFLELRGSLKTNKKPLSSHEIHDLFAEETAERYGEK